jgi:hypothetical protein
MTRAVHHLGEQRKNVQIAAREEETQKKYQDVAEDERTLNVRLAVQEETASWPLKQAISLLGIFNVFFLINVDSYTRDDLMSMVAVKLCANVVRPGLVLEDASLNGLVNLFEGMHVTPALMKSLQNPSGRIVRSRRSGEWLLTDLEYNNYLAADSRKEAEPLSQIVKLQTLNRMTVHRVEASLQSLALLLIPEKGVEEYSSDLFHQEGDRRRAFFRSLLELTNACMRAYSAENLEKVFEDLVLNPLSKLGGSEHPERVRKLKHRQDLALLALHQEVQTLRDANHARRFKDDHFEDTDYAEQRITRSFRNLLFDRLRVLCIFQLQLVNVSAYNETGHAIKLSAMLSDPLLTEKEVPLYWLICFHASLDSLGYDAHTLQALLDVWVPPPNAKVPNLLVQEGSQVAEAKKTFSRMRSLLKHIGKTPETKAFVDLYRGHKDVFLELALKFLEHFPESMHKEHPPKATTRPDCRHDPGAPSPFEGISRAILKGHEIDLHMRADQIERVVCAVTQWFEFEEGSHSHMSKTLKKSLPSPRNIPEEVKSSSSSSRGVRRESRKSMPPKPTTKAEILLKSIRAHKPAPLDSKTWSPSERSLSSSSSSSKSRSSSIGSEDSSRSRSSSSKG